MRALERSGQWLTAFLIGLFAIPPAALLVGLASERSFWAAVLSWAPLYIIVGVMRDPLRSLGPAPRFVAWFCICVTGMAFFMAGRGEEFDLAIAAGIGLAWAILDLLVEHLRSKRKRSMADQ